MITTCTTCGANYDAGSEEQANEPARYCPGCWAKRKTACKHSLDVSPSGHMASCKLCGFVGRWRDGTWEKVEERASVPPATADQTTPGPWKAAGVAWEVASGVWTRHIYTTEFVRGVVLGHQARGSTEAEVDANARLIAAAPDLYAIVRAEYDEHDGFRTLPMGYPADRAAAICAAIAKAEGGAA